MPVLESGVKYALQPPDGASKHLMLLFWCNKMVPARQPTQGTVLSHIAESKLACWKLATGCHRLIAAEEPPKLEISSFQLQ